MSQLARKVAPSAYIKSPAARLKLKNALGTDLAFRHWHKNYKVQIPLWISSRLRGGSGFQMATELRSYFQEFANRAIQYGYDAMPTSFNVLEPFLRFDERFLLFDIRPEREHLLAVDHFFKWYSTDRSSKTLEIALEAMSEGEIYSFDLVGDAGGYRIPIGSTSCVLAGISMIRHESELSCLLLAGEEPPSISDSDAVLVLTDVRSPENKRDLVPHPKLTVKDRYLKAFPGFARLLLLTRLDLKTEKHPLRYLLKDVGNGYRVFTDDSEVFDGLDDRSTYEDAGIRELGRYASLFHSLDALAYLPLYFLDLGNCPAVQEIQFPTDIGCRPADKLTKRMHQELGPELCVAHRSVKCLRSVSADPPEVMTITAPKNSFESQGYWKQLAPGELGEDKNGNPVAGKTWVERTDVSTRVDARSLLLKPQTMTTAGADPGVIYVMRTAAYELDVYKIGLTRIGADKRAKELSTTGVALPFGVLATFRVGECRKIEAEVHRLLDRHRVSRKREFFRLPLEDIISTIQGVVQTYRTATT